MKSGCLTLVLIFFAVYGVVSLLGSLPTWALLLVTGLIGLWGYWKWGRTEG